MLLALNNPTVHYFSLDIEGAELKVFFYTMVGNYINTMNSTFNLNFNVYQTLKQHGYIKAWKQREAVNFKYVSSITCKPGIWKKLVKD